MSKMIIVDSEQRRGRAMHILGSLPLKPPFQVVIEAYSPKRSTQQNKRYWLLIEMVAKHTGHDKDEVHDFAKQKFLGTRTIEIAGERAQVAPSTRRLKVKEFKDYMDNVENWMITEFGLWLD